jgi:hypothetical protein
MTDPARQHLKDQRKAAKQEHRASKKVEIAESALPTHIDCACVIHSTGYDWIYVDRLYSMLSRHISLPIRMHVYTEKDRVVPDHMIKHVLEDWPTAAGPKKSWWHKMELFNAEHHQGPVLYLDLDTVIVDNIDWIFAGSPKNFWAIRDFKRLWKSDYTGINSSVMWWDTREYDWVWQSFKTSNLQKLQKEFHGDQDYITQLIDYKHRRFFDENKVVSWRWQALDGGMDFKKRTYITPGSGTKIAPGNSLLIFHGNPKPSNVKDAVILNHWR